MKWKTAILVGALFFSISDCVHAQGKPRVVHVFIALADNQHQGIVPVPAALGNGDDPARNLYWGAAFGVRTYFRRSLEWKETLHVENPYKAILERSVFQHGTENVRLVADAYRGLEIKQALKDFLSAAAGIRLHDLSFRVEEVHRRDSSPRRRARRVLHRWLRGLSVGGC